MVQSIIKGAVNFPVSYVRYSNATRNSNYSGNNNADLRGKAPTANTLNHAETITQLD